jgi:hypothetical protein
MPTTGVSDPYRQVPHPAQAVLKGAASAALTFSMLWFATLVVQYLVLDGGASPLPPPGAVWVRGPTVLIAVLVGAYVAWKSWCWWDRVMAWLSVAVLVTFVTAPLLYDRAKEQSFLAEGPCTGAKRDVTAADLPMRGDAMGTSYSATSLCVAPELADDSDALLAAGHQACDWLGRQPWGVPRDARGGDYLSVVAGLYRDYLRDHEIPRTNQSVDELRSYQAAIPAWFSLCPFQQSVHKKLGSYRG